MIQWTVTMQISAINTTSCLYKYAHLWYIIIGVIKRPSHFCVHTFTFQNYIRDTLHEG